MVKVSYDPYWVLCDRQHARRWVHITISLWLWVLLVSHVYVYSLFLIRLFKASWK